MFSRPTLQIGFQASMAIRGQILDKSTPFQVTFRVFLAETAYGQALCSGLQGAHT